MHKDLDHHQLNILSVGEVEQAPIGKKRCASFGLILKPLDVGDSYKVYWIQSEKGSFNALNWSSFCNDGFNDS